MPQSINQYFFGNSLVNFTDNGDSHANVPIWMDLFAQAAGNTYAVSGSFGFLRSFADRAEPFAQWGFPGVVGAWEPDEQPFSEAQFDNILITPANFIQGESPDTDYFGDNRSPLDAVLDVVGEMVADHPGTPLLIYEGWPDMAPYALELPITDAAWADYHAYTLGAYHDWYETLVDAVNAAYPTADVTLLPVATILADLFMGVLEDVPSSALYVDTAPHGSDTLYFLAAMITYQATYGTPAPLPADLPVTIHPEVLTQFDAVNIRIEQALEAIGFVIDGAPAPVQLADGYGDFDATFFVVDPAVTDLDGVDFDQPPVAEQRFVSLDFLYESGPLWEGGPEDHIAVRYDRVVNSPEGGVYTLRLTADDAARVYVDGLLMLDSADGAPEETLVAEVTLSAGTHEIEVFYLDVTQEASLQLDWDLSGPLPPAAPVLDDPPQAAPEAAVATEEAGVLGAEAADSFAWRAPTEWDMSPRMALLAEWDGGVGAPWALGLAEFWGRRDIDSLESGGRVAIAPELEDRLGGLMFFDTFDPWV